MCQVMAASCICDPITETIWPIQSKRKSRWRSDAKALWRSVVAVCGESDARFVSGIDEPIYIARRLRTKRTLRPKQKSGSIPSRSNFASISLQLLQLLCAFELLVHVFDVGRREILKSETLVFLRQFQLFLRLIDREAVGNSLLHARAQVVKIVAKVSNVRSRRYVAMAGNKLRSGMLFQDCIERGNPIVDCRVNQIRQSL